MTRGPKPLDPKVKQERQRVARREYEERNKGERREKARLRMQVRRAAMASADIITEMKQKVHNGARYRNQKLSKSVKPQPSKLTRPKDCASPSALKPSATALSTAPATPKPKSWCYKCSDGCPGCACMCPFSAEWFEHEGGHFFVTCTARGGKECPGCACTCPKSKEWKEHGGHLCAKKRVKKNPIV
ncbi:hypothetical protein K438DRAFT_1785074 [Mycena galopus ATCC 62051]|nr:hypothetical protein K438DRAFT_1785074 [Mycena galopus ATCC 62051]